MPRKLQSHKSHSVSKCLQTANNSTNIMTYIHTDTEYLANNALQRFRYTHRNRNISMANVAEGFLEKLMVMNFNAEGSVTATLHCLAASRL